MKRPGISGRVVLAIGALLGGCRTTVAWRPDTVAAIADARALGQELVLFFALPGRELSDRMQAQLDDPRVQAALVEGGFAATIADGEQRKNLYQTWVGFGEGMGTVVLGTDGQCHAARPGPQDPDELAAWLRLCARSREALAAARAAVAAARPDPLAQHRLGCLYLQLGSTRLAEPLLLDAATAGVADARHRLARLYALDGNLAAARRWLVHGPRTGPALVSEGYLLFKERRHREAIAVLEEALAAGELGDERQRAVLFLGKALHEDKQDQRALPLLEALANEGTGSTFEAAARHTLQHLRDPQHGHSH